MEEPTQEVFELLAEALKGKTEQVFGFFQGETNGFLLTHKGQQYVLQLRERDEEESFTLFEI